MEIFTHSRYWDEGVYISDLLKNYFEKNGHIVHKICDNKISKIPNIKYDIAFGWGLSNTLKHVRDELNVPTLVFDLGMIKRTETPMTNDGYFRCGIYDEKWLNIDKRGDSSRFDELCLDYGDYSKKDGLIAFMGQIPGDVSHGMGEDDLISWSRRIIVKLNEKYPNQIVYKPHPHAAHMSKQKLFMDQLSQMGVMVDRSTNRIETLDVKNKYRCVFSYCSTSLVHFIINGIPVVASKNSMFHELVSDIDGDWDIDFKPDQEIKQKWFNAMAYSQWNKEEISNGLLFNNLKKYLIK
jgi:hypothetical protein